jgi:hypothetical protein
MRCPLPLLALPAAGLLSLSACGGPAAPPADGHAAIADDRLGAKHVLVMYRGSMKAPPEVTRTREEARALAQRVSAEARQGGKFKALVAQYSDEPGAAGRGGDLGTFKRGAMVPEFEAALLGLEPGGISEPVETPFGFHVILRTR